MGRKNWFESEFGIDLTEKQYRQIVEEYNNSNCCDIITEEVRDWVIDNDIIESVKDES